MEGMMDFLKGVEKKVQNSADWEQKCSRCDNIVKIDPAKHSYRPYSINCDDCEKKEKIERFNVRVKEKLELIIPPKFREIATDKGELLKKCQGKSVFCYGSAGTGKTVFAISLARAYIRIGKDVRYHSYPTLIMKLRNAYRKDTFDGKSPWDIAESTAQFDGVLILDDLGAEKTTDFVKEITYFILNEREINLRITIITSNFSLDELNDSIDPRISSRIAGMCEVLKFTGKDRRIKEK